MDYQCAYCGGEIVFRYVDGRRTPIHVGGQFCEGGSGGERQPASAPKPSPKDPKQDGFCRPARCPECGESVFFLRHNGGSVWLDDLGWPWPKHPCFDGAVPAWYRYFVDQPPPASPSVIGVVVRARWVPPIAEGPAKLLLAIDAQRFGRFCLAVPGVNSESHLLGRLASVDTVGWRLTTSNHEVREILDLDVPPPAIGLPESWASRRS